MKRNLILMGGKTYVLSIPIEWVKKHGLKKGDGLDVEQDIGKITISTEGIKPTKKAIAMEYSKEQLIKTYQLGYDEIKITGKFNMQEIESVLNNFMPGFEIMHSGKGFCRIECISEISPKDIDTLIRKAFLLLSNISPKDELRKHSITRTINLCKRCISRKGYSNFQESLVMYNLLCEIEKASVAGRQLKPMAGLYERFTDMKQNEINEIKENAFAFPIADSVQDLAMIRA